MMLHNKLQPLVAWTEDRATQRRDPSADPGAETKGRAVRSGTAAVARPPFGTGTQAANLRGMVPRLSRQDALCRRANAKRQEVQFPVNQHTRFHNPLISMETRLCLCVKVWQGFLFWQSWLISCVWLRDRPLRM